jgi:hypothetical protein
MPDFETNPMLERLDTIAALLCSLVAKEQSRPPRLLRLKPAAAYLSISVGALRTLIQNGQIEVIKLNENCERVPWLVDRADLDAWIQKSKVTF